MVSTPNLGFAGYAAIVLIITVTLTAGITGITTPDDRVTVTETQNGVEIVNHGDKPVTATIDSTLHTFNTTIGTERPVVVPVDNSTDVTVHT